MATTPSLPSPSSSPPLPQPQQHQQPPQQQQQQQQQQPTHEPNTGPAAIIATNTNSSNNDNINSNKVSVACQTDPNLIDKLVDNHIRRQLDEVDLYQDYVRSAQCTQFWPLDKNPIRLLVPTMLKVDLPEQHLKNESLMFDLVQAITTNSKLVNLLAKYIHHIVPNVIISKRIDLIPLITCTIRVCPDIKEQERLISLLFNLIKRPNEEQRRMILSGIIVVLQVSPHQNSSLLLPNLWDHVSDKFPERRILLAESCATLAHYVRPIMRTNLVLSILIQLLKDKNAAVRSAACKSFACLLTLIMDRNDEVFDACLSATEDIIQDMLQQTPVSFCEHRFELEQMRFCILETIYPLISMWAVKLDRFKVEVAEFYLAKADKYFANLLNGNTTNSSGQNNSQGSFGVPPNNCTSAFESHVNQTITGSALASLSQQNQQQQQPSRASLAAAAVSKRRSMFLESRLASSFSSSSSSSGLGSSSGSSSLSSPSSTLSSTGGNIITSSANMLRRQSAYVTLGPTTSESSTATSSAMLSSQRAINAYLKMLSYLVPFVFSDAVHSCAWLTKSKLHLPSAASENNLSGNPSGRYRDPNNNNNGGNQCGRSSPSSASLYEFTNEINSGLGGGDATTREFSLKAGHGDKLSFVNKLLEPTMIVDESAIVAFHDQLKQEHMTIDSVSWLLDKFLPKFLNVLTHFSHKKFYLVAAAGNSNDAAAHEFLTTTIGSVRQLCLLFGKHLAHSKLRLLIKKHVTSVPALFFLYIASLTAFEPIEQQEYEEILASVKQNLSMPELTRSHVEITAISVKILATNSEQIHSPSTRQKFLTYVLDALVNYSNQIKLSSQSKEFMLIMFRHILTCLIDPQLRPSEWAQILVTKFLPLLIMLANDSSDVYVCTYARLMCAQLVETFDNHLSCPKLTQQTASSIMPALNSLKSLTEQIKASNLKRQIDCLTSNLNEKFFKHQQQAATTTATTTTTVGPEARTPPAATVGGASVVEQKQ